MLSVSYGWCACITRNEEPGFSTGLGVARRDERGVADIVVAGPGGVVRSWVTCVTRKSDQVKG